MKSEFSRLFKTLVLQRKELYNVLNYLL